MFRRLLCGVVIVSLGGVALGQDDIFIPPIVVARTHTPRPTQTPTLTQTKTPSTTPTLTLTAAPSATPTRKPCPGDINHDGTVTINEVIQAVNAAMGGCP